MANQSQVLRLQVERSGRTASYEVYGGLVLVGSGSHCDVRLLPEDAALQQLQIELRGSEVHARSLAPEHDCRLAGAPFAFGVLPADAELTLGQTTLRIQLTESQGRKQRAGAAGSPTFVRVLGFAAIALGLYFVLQEQPPVDLLEQTVDHPSLFGAPQTECAATARGEPEFHASRLIREAQSSERAPFFPRTESRRCRASRSGRASSGSVDPRSPADERAGRRCGSAFGRVPHQTVRLERSSAPRILAAQREVHVCRTSSVDRTARTRSGSPRQRESTRASPAPKKG